MTPDERNTNPLLAGGEQGRRPKGEHNLTELGKYIDGRSLTYDERDGTFKIGNALVSVDQVRGYSSGRQIAWLTPDLIAWFDRTAGARPRATIKGMITGPTVAIGLVVALLAIRGVLALLSPATTILGTRSSGSKTSAHVLPPPPEPTSAPTVALATPANHQPLSARQFKIVVKDPDAHIGEGYLIYGQVQQFDAATGGEAFRADTGPNKKKKSPLGFVSYEQNSLMVGQKSQLSDVVRGDLFSAKVTVLASYTYTNGMGGATTVPQFRVDAIEVYGNAE